MDHFDGITPEQRWKNDLLYYMKENNRMLNEMLLDKKPKEVVKESAIEPDDGQMTLELPEQPIKKGASKR